MTADLMALSAPFPEEEIDWRIGRAGKKGNGQVWATCLAYVQARAIMNRLDEVCGPSGWKVSYRFVGGHDKMDPGVICELAIRAGDQWVTKEDGAEQTDIESFKGGLSSALKRAGAAWGIGRYLYRLEATFASIVTDPKGANWAKTKEGHEFYWLPPALPAWALPDPSMARLGNIGPQQPLAGDGTIVSAWRVPGGTWAKRSLEEIPIDEMRRYVVAQEKKIADKKTLIPAWLPDTLARMSEYIADFENVNFNSARESRVGVAE